MVPLPDIQTPGQPSTEAIWPMDLAILTMACRWFLQLAPLPVVKEHVAEIDRSGRWEPL